MMMMVSKLKQFLSLNNKLFYSVCISALIGLISSTLPAASVTPICSFLAGRQGVSSLFLDLYPKTIQDVTAANKKTISEMITTGNKAEQWSGNHQIDVEKFIEIGQDQVPGINKDALFNGMADSDKGKHGDYKVLLTSPSLASNQLIQFCQGQGKAGLLLKGIFNNAGLGDVTLLNPALSADQIRDGFKKVPSLVGYLHEIPGMADAVFAFNNGALTPEQFSAQIRANLFHNGPAEGFWKLLGENFVPGGMAKANLDPKDFFQGTVFQPKAGNKLNYPGPISAEGILHTIGDRLSQGTTGGVIKIYYEIIGFTPPLQAISELLIQNPSGTKSQFGALAVQIDQLKSSNLISAEQGIALSEVLKRASHSLDLFAAKTKDAISNYDEIVQRLGSEPPMPIETLTIGNQTFKASDFEAPQAKEDFAVKIYNILIGIESQMGNPMTSAGPS